MPFYIGASWGPVNPFFYFSFLDQLFWINFFHIFFYSSSHKIYCSMAREQHLYDCPCGRKHHSRSTVLAHKKRAAAPQAEPPGAPEVVKSRVQSDARTRVQTDGHSPVQKILMAEEFKRMKDKVEPKKGQEKPGKDKEKNERDSEGEHHERKQVQAQAPAADHGRGDPDYRCGHCGHEFWQKSRPKACPDCGKVFG